MGEVLEFRLPQPGSEEWESRCESLERMLYKDGVSRSRAARMLDADFRQLAKDLAVEAMVRARRRGLQGFDSSKGDLGLWLFYQARKLLRSELRAELRRSKIVRILCEEAHAEIRSEAAPADRVCDRETLERALEKLPAGQRQALELYYFSDLSTPEVAKVTGKDAEAVSSLLRRARDNLRKALDGQSRRRPGRPRGSGRPKGES
jgi:RNA polymerase sigma-70 factor (ECF subfamily)